MVRKRVLFQYLPVLLLLLLVLELVLGWCWCCTSAATVMRGGEEKTRVQHAWGSEGRK